MKQQKLEEEKQKLKEVNGRKIEKKKRNGKN